MITIAVQTLVYSVPHLELLLEDLFVNLKQLICFSRVSNYYAKVFIKHYFFFYINIHLR